MGLIGLAMASCGGLWGMLAGLAKSTDHVLCKGPCESIEAFQELPRYTLWHGQGRGYRRTIYGLRKVMGRGVTSRVPPKGLHLSWNPNWVVVKRLNSVTMLHRDTCQTRRGS